MLSLAQRIPVRIDISWMKARAPEDDTSVRPTEHELIERSRLVARILEMNPTASSDFLQTFQLHDLSAYLSPAAASPAGSGPTTHRASRPRSHETEPRTQSAPTRVGRGLEGRDQRWVPGQPLHI